MRHLLHGMIGDRRGAMAVEFAMVAPILLLLGLGVVQFGSIYFLEHAMYDVARDAVRPLATGEMDQAEAEAFALSQLPGDPARYTLTVTPPSGSGPSGDMYRFEIEIPMEEVAPVDPAGMFTGQTLRVGVSMREES